MLHYFIVFLLIIFFIYNHFYLYLNIFILYIKIFFYYKCFYKLEIIFLYRRYFINDTALQDHFTTKVHKRRLKALELEPYSIEESERAAGKGNYIIPKKRKIETINYTNYNMDVEPETSSQVKIVKVDV